jgi:hypothetical protein
MQDKLYDRSALLSSAAEARGAYALLFYAQLPVLYPLDTLQTGQAE